MNINEFAERIVFGTSLEDKLLSPSQVTFEKTTSVDVESLSAPGRPDGLEMFHGTGVGSQPPAEDRLESEQARGQLLHFLANHELLATELMALVLLKFPEAPRAFRQGVFVTLQEEQEHTRMYLRRMQQCGVEFGSFPLSGQFWRVVEPMRSPMDFVSRLSLTFEQANLDYSLHFASVFKRIGDDSTSALLQQVYEDEIGHVKHGLHWFRQWKNPEESDWEAYQSVLSFPMSPQRARGPKASFNRLGRERAGLTRDFIDSVELYRQSRGRMPTIRWFDSAVEAELGEQSIGKSRSQLEQLSIDLELAMIPLAKQDDVVLLRRLPGKALQQHWLDSGLEIPELFLMDQLDELNQRKLTNFQPWAWSPENHELVQPLMASVRELPKPWSAGDAELFRKSWLVEKRKRWSDFFDDQPWFAERSECEGKTILDVNEIPNSLDVFKKQGVSSVLFKGDFGTAGRGQRKLSCEFGLTEEDEKWLKSVSRNSQGVGPLGIVEPELERIIDLSFLWQVDDSGVFRFLSWTRAITAKGRRYQGTRLGTPFSDLNPDLKRFLLEDRSVRLRQVVSRLDRCLLPELRQRNFSGPFGVDAFVFRRRDGSFAIQPWVELNPRNTMGHVAVAIEANLAPGVVSEFRVLSRLEWDRWSGPLERTPLIKSNDGHWKSGVVMLGEVKPATKLVPVILIGREAIQMCKNS